MSINEFIASFRGGTRPNRFMVQITYPAAVGTPNIEDKIVVTAAALPSSTVGVVQANYMGRQIPLPGDRTFEQWTITIVNDTTFSHRSSFERWMNLIIGHESNVQGVDNVRDLMMTLDVTQLDRQDQPLKNYKLYNAFPTNLSQIDLGYDQNDTLSTYTVDFQYSHWGSVSTPTS